ncbi:MAG: cation diffusion facilitator family transporter [Phycisphaerae bacterium]
MTPDKRKTTAAWVSVASNSGLIAAKVVVGTIIGSVSVISEAIHSGVDLLAAVIALLAVRESSKPADERHPYGHGKFENISGTVEAVLIFVAAGWIVYKAGKKFVHPAEITPGWGVAVMLVSALVNWRVSRMLFRVGKETDSIALQADGWHLRTDVWTSAGVMAGLGLIWAGDIIVANIGGLAPARRDAIQKALHWIDPIAAILVAGLIVKAAWELTVRSARDLMDVQWPPEEEAWLREMLKTLGPSVHGFHRIRTRKSGADRFVELHIFVEAAMTVEESHRLSHEIGQRVQEHFSNAGHSHVLVHVEPCAGRCDEQGCRAGCLLDESVRQAIRQRRQDELP